MRMTKKIGAMVLAAALSLSMALPAFAGQWIFDGPESWKWWYKEDNGSYPHSEWKQINGEWYNFDENGYMNVGWINDPIQTVHEDEDGGWVEKFNRYYYLDESGKMLKNQNYIGGYTDETGLLHCDGLDLGSGVYSRYKTKNYPKPPVEDSGILEYHDYGEHDYYRYSINDYKTAFYAEVSKHIAKRETSFTVTLNRLNSRRDGAILWEGINEVFLQNNLIADKWNYDYKTDDNTVYFNVVGYDEGV